MIRRILVPTDGYGLEDHVISYVARAFPDAEFHVISVVNTYERGVQLTNLLYEEMRDSAEKAIMEATRKLEGFGIRDVKPILLEGLPSKEIVKYAKLHDIDLIAMRVYSRRHTASAHRLGSTVRNVMRRSRIPVLTVADECHRIPIRRVLLLTDGTSKTKRAENFAILLASSYGLILDVMYLLWEGGSEEHAGKIINNVVWKAQHWGVKIDRRIIEGDFKRTTEHLLEDDLIVMGVGKPGFFRCKIGHVAQYIATHSPVPVIFVRKMKERWLKRTSRR